MPSPEVVKKAISEISKRAVNYEYFFDHLRSPNWIGPLEQEGIFNFPPPSRKEGDYISSPSWPVSRYLVRMASQAPELVVRIMLKIPKTDNVRVHEDIADVACSIPPELAVPLARNEAKWVNSQRHLYLLLPEKVGKLVGHLARGGQAKAALDLARVLLAVMPDPGSAEDETRLSFVEPKFRIDEWDYRQIVAKEIPDLVRAAGVGALALLCDLLRDASRLSSVPSEDEALDPGSCITRPAIEGESLEHVHTVQDALITAVRDAGEVLAPQFGKPVLDVIEGYQYKLFLRIGLHLRRRWPQLDPEGTARLLVDATVVDDPVLHHEVFLLLREQFGNLPPDTKSAYLAIVARGLVGEGHSDRLVRHWQYTKLWPIQAFLDQAWQARFEGLRSEFGDPEDPSALTHVSEMLVGPTSPKSLEELRSMSVEALVSFLKTWRPSGEFMAPSPDGLGRELTALVASEPERFAADAGRFQSVEPTYARGLLSGFREAVKQKCTFPWLPLLDLCYWIVSQPRENPDGEGEDGDADPGWGWSRRTIADLLAAGFEDTVAQIPFVLRDVAWEALRPITEDPEPTLRHEARYGGTNMDPVTLCINTTRGQAIHAVVAYALWVRRNIDQAPDGTPRASRGFDTMPEVREVLDYHLDPANDPSPAIRSAYGQRFPVLTWLDAEWAARRVRSIFPDGESIKHLRNAAWEAYMAFNCVYDNVFALLRVDYGHAIDDIGTEAGPGRHLVNVDERLAEHLIAEYWRGKLELHESGGLLDRFYQNASAALRKHVLVFVGRSLHNTPGDVGQQVLDRLKVLWEERAGAVHVVAEGDDWPTEFSAFGWWFVSAKFADNWSIEQLKVAVKLSGTLDVDYLVIERLARLSQEKPLAAVECLRQMVERDTKRWALLVSEENARVILKSALNCADDDARKAAEDLVNQLGARGHLAFRDLLPRQQKPPA